jgi:hypothetical protein
MEETLTFTPQGFVRVYKTFVDSGESEDVFLGPNLIVKTGREIILDQIHYPSGTGDPLRFARVGTGGAIDPAGLFLKVPTVEMTNLYNPVASASIVRTGRDPSVPSVVLLASLDSSAGNGFIINEAGFFSESGKMFNIRVFAGISKTSAFSLNFEWTIKML